MTELYLILSAPYPMEFYVHQFQFFINLFLTAPSAVVLSVCIGVGYCLCPIY